MLAAKVKVLEAKENALVQCILLASASERHLRVQLVSDA